MNDDNINKINSDEDNYDELLKNFMPRSEEGIQAQSKDMSSEINVEKSKTDTKKGIYFSQTKSKKPDTDNQNANKPPVYPVQTDKSTHVLIPPEQNTMRIQSPASTQQRSSAQSNSQQSYVQQPYNAQNTRQSPPAQPVGRTSSAASFPSQQTASFPPQQRTPAADSSQVRRSVSTSAQQNTAQRTATARASEAVKKQAQPTKSSKKSNTASSSKAINSKAGGKRGSKKSNSARYNSMMRLVICLASVALIIGAAALIKVPLMGCVNDIIAIDGTDDEVSVTVSEGMSTKQIIDMLADKGLINNAMFCNLMSDFLGFGSDTEYPAGTYTLTSDMGVEGMLAEIVAAGKDTKTVALTFPEGYTVEQIIARLASNGVASTGSMYAAIDDYEFTGMFEHLNSIRDRDTRFNALEGYLYPDTYDFYVGENPNSVIKKFLSNFEEKWTEVYSERAEELGYSLDEILMIASIIEKEAFDAQQMPIVSSVLQNRLGASALYPHLECDSTTDYVEKLYDDSKINSAEYYSLLMLYDTYQVSGLPEGPICNPGGDSIKAALYPDSTLYYYFMHDKQGNIYLASTAEEHAANAVAAGIN